MPWDIKNSFGTLVVRVYEVLAYYKVNRTFYADQTLLDEANMVVNGDQYSLHHNGSIGMHNCEQVLGRPNVVQANDVVFCGTQVRFICLIVERFGWKSIVT